MNDYAICSAFRHVGTGHISPCMLFQACDNGRGVLLLSVAWGKVSEGIDFGRYTNVGGATAVAQ